jgi:hypothetical protein
MPPVYVAGLTRSPTIVDFGAMTTVNFTHAYYIKLGSGGKYEESSIRENKLRFGWNRIPVEEINQRNWAALKEKYRHEYKSSGSATADIKALRTIVESTPDDVWISFHASHLWWCRVVGTEVFEDSISRYRLVNGQWRNCDIFDQPLIINQIPGSLSKVQGFRGTVCGVREIDDLRRLLNNQPSEAFMAISKAKKALCGEIESGIKRLHWKDFETLVDLVFRGAGWRRTSVLGETMKYADIELEEPITNDLYQVQIKSAATFNDFEEYAQNFSHVSFRKLYFVVHSPDEKLFTHQSVDGNVELVLPNRLARMVN